MASPPPDLARLADACVLCGLCLPHCPTYALDRLEAESPRGRIMAAKALAADAAALGERGAAHLDHCLGCRQCERVCPARVEYGALLRGVRALQRRDRAPPWRQRLLEWVVASPGRTRAALGALRVLRAITPPPLRQRLPAVHAAPGPGRREPSPPARGTVALATGCLARGLGAPAIDAAARLLQAAGYTVEIPPEQGCCGALSAHAGDAEGAAALAARHRAAFPDQVDAVLVLDSGCQEAWALGFGGSPPVTDPISFLEQRGDLERLALRRLDRRVALHLPCTQRNVTRSDAATRRALALIPGLDLQPLPEGHGCCGAAGSHALLEPARADALRRPVLDAIVSARADTLASANIGCRIHLATAPGRPAPRAVHPVELLAEALDSDHHALP